MKKILTTIFTATIALCAIAAPKTYVALSPDGKLKVNVTEGKNIAYTLTYDGTQLISPSPISMSLADGSIYGGTMKAKKALLKSVDESIKTVAYKKASVKDHYNELTLQYATFDLKFRVYDDGMAYRFISKAAEPTSSIKVRAGYIRLPMQTGRLMSLIRMDICLLSKDNL
jgi:alpha-glucosidase